MSGRRWTEEDIEYLEDEWGRLDRRAIAENLNRTTDAVSNKAFLLGARHNNELMRVSEVSEALSVPRRTLVNTWRKRYGFPCSKSYWGYCIKYDDLMIWLHEHPDLWSAKKVEPYALGTEPEWLVEKRKNEVFLKRGSPWSEYEKSLAFAMLKQGKSHRDIGLYFGRTAESARKLFFRHRRESYKNRQEGAAWLIAE